jgi:hypothetical protein
MSASSPSTVAGAETEAAVAVARALAPRWRGQSERLEVWYATWTDPESGAGGWIHHELVAPVDGDAYVHGWAALFAPESEPVLERFGRESVTRSEQTAADGRWPSLPEAALEPPVLRGNAGRLAWDMRWEDGPAGPSTPLFTFPEWAWSREALPGAQIVPVPAARFAGTLSIDGTSSTLSEFACGNVAHIYGHGNAERWGWLHAELGGGDVLEIVAAVSRRPGLDRLPPLALVQLRAGGRDWPRDPLVAAPLFRTRLDLPTWQVRGTVGRWRLRVEVELPESKSVSLGYEDPDGATATCTNSEVANAEIVLEHRRRHWETASSWTLRGRAHAEIGTRP